MKTKFKQTKGNVLLNFYIDVDLKAKLWFVSGYHQQSLSKTIVKALEEYVKKPEVEEMISQKIIFDKKPKIPKYITDEFQAPPESTIEKWQD